MYGALHGDYTCQLFKAADSDKAKNCQCCRSENIEMTLLIPKNKEIDIFEACNQCMSEVLNKTNIRIHPKY